MSAIELKDEDEAREFVGGYLEGFTKVETTLDLECMYKDLTPATTVFKQESTGKYFALDWNKYTSHYGDGESEFHNKILYEVKRVDVVKTVTEWHVKE